MIFFVSPDIMEKSSYDLNSASNILSHSILPDLLTELTLVIFTLNILNASRCLTSRKIKPLIIALVYS